MAQQQMTVLPGYENIWGTKKSCIIELTGPTLYAANGQRIDASQLGWGGIEAVIPLGKSYSGTYYVGPIQYGLAVQAPPASALGAVPTVKVPWYVTATGVEAGALDLDEEMIRLLIIGV